MLKKIILFFLIFFSFFWLETFWNCEYDPDSADIVFDIDRCLDSTTLLNPIDDLDVEGWAKDLIIWWTMNLSILLSLFAISAIVMWWFSMVISSWDEEKIKKWKEKVKWWILWFLAIVWANSIIVLIVNIMYWI